MSLTRREALQLLTTAGAAIYPEREAAIVARMILSAKSGIGEASLIADPTAPIEIDNMAQLVEEVKSGRPVQYIVGSCEFCDLKFHVREGCLIPRPETEELVLQIADKHPSAQRILDVGTGSGCIAIALKRKLPAASVEALDYSTEALEIARENCTLSHVAITLLQGDALHLEQAVRGPYDLIVSNPPYIPQSEALEMRRNVIGFEPHEALFVPDNDPLRFYRAIGQAALNLLAPQGELWFELHESYADQTAALLYKMGYKEVEVLCDLNDKKRMLWSRR